MSRPGFNIKIQTLVRIIYVLGAIGMVLAVIGIFSAYDKVGLTSAAGNVITAAIVVVVVSLSVVISYTRRQYHQRGPVILCIDRSNSMVPPLQEWAQGLVAGLKDQAVAQGRNLWVLYFDHGDPEAHFYPKGVGPLAPFPQVYGGTRFDLVIDRALDLSPPTAGRRTNIVFVTDGFAPMDVDWLKQVEIRKKALKVTIDAVVLYDPRYPDFKLPFADTIEQVDFRKPLPAETLLINGRLA